MLGGMTASELRGLKLAAFVGIVVAVVTFIIAVVILVLMSIATDTINNLKVSSGCGDNNDCTYDYEKDTGGCINLPKAIGTSCRSECYEAEATDQTCSSLQLTPGVLAPVCTSPSQQYCKGFCLADVDCPVLSTIAGDVAGECFATTCYYRIDPTDGATVDGDEIPDLVCNRDYQIYQTTCESYLNTSNSLVKSRCIISDVQCETVPTNLGTASAAICYYYHACSVQQYIPLVLKKRMVQAFSERNNRGRNTKNALPNAPQTSNSDVNRGKKDRPFNLIEHKFTSKNKRVNPAPPQAVKPARTNIDSKAAASQSVDQEKKSTLAQPKLGIRL